VQAAVRHARDSDLAALTEIYNHYVATSPATFDLEPFTPEQCRRWLEHYREATAHQCLVAELGERVLGYATSSRFRPKPAYDTTVETTVYVRPAAARRGVGSLLYAELFRRLEPEDVRRAVAVIVQPNEASVRLHLRFGFREAGRFTQLGRKFGRYWDVTWYEKALGLRR
jgi:phosphinothricin acetyltransferase